AEKAVKDCETELAKTSEALTGAVTKSSASSGAAIEDVASSADSSESGEPNAPIPHPSLVAPTVQEDVPNLGDCSTGDHTVVLWKGTRCDGGNGAWAGGTPGTLYGVQYVGDHINDATNSYGKGIFTNVINLYRDADYGGCISTYYGQHLSFPGQNYNNCSAPVALSNSVSSLTFKAS
ncbi:MAG: hypothetical protein U0904_05530, partial [Candidatus Nanopelagicales bacterium]|nr:hypothetical protein [Candidatus Nanopelagicales bacterium]